MTILDTPTRHFPTERAAQIVAHQCNADDPYFRYDVVMTPRSTYVIAVIERGKRGELLGFL
jgi:hypothetical protein